MICSKEFISRDDHDKPCAQAQQAEVQRLQSVQPVRWVSQLETFECVTHPVKSITTNDESRQLEQRIAPGKFEVYDVVLDDGTWLADTVVIGDQAFALVIGGQTGFQYFRSIPEMAGRSIAHSLRLRRHHYSLFFGCWLRRRWARSVGALIEHPRWRARI